MFFRKPGNKGFTLIEIIISILSFSLACGTVLQLFILSGTLEEKTVNYEMASVNASNAIEWCREAETPYSLQDAYYFNNADIRRTDSAVYAKKYYDDEWNELPADTLTYRFALYLEICLSKANGPEGTQSPALYRINAEVLTSSGTQLVSYDTSVYYSPGRRP